MNAKQMAQAVWAVSLCFVLSGSAAAQMGLPVVEPIAATLPAQPPGNVFEQFYPNEFDLLHPKKLTFQGTITNGSTFAPAFVDLWFDWIDPRDPSGTPPHTSPIVPIDLAPGQTNLYLPRGLEPIMFTIPFCPPQVSIHIQNNGPGQPVIVEGQFIHQCIPEPNTLALVGMCAMGLAGAIRRRWTG